MKEVFNARRQANEQENQGKQCCHASTRACDFGAKQKYQSHAARSKANRRIWLHSNAARNDALEKLQFQGPAQQDGDPKDYEGERPKPCRFPQLGFVSGHELQLCPPSQQDRYCSSATSDPNTISTTAANRSPCKTAESVRNLMPLQAY